MTQPDLFSAAPTPRQKKRGHVPASSVAAYLERPRDGRVAFAVWALSYAPRPLTSAELTKRVHEQQYDTDRLLYIRRGLSDALKLGLVSHAGERKCSVSGRTCLTWRVVGR